MSYTRTITSNGNSISQEGGQSFNQQLDDLQEQIEEGGGGSITDLGTSSGTANALAGASLVDTATTFTDGRLYRIRTNAANSGAATCSINGGTGVAMKKSPSSAALASGDIADATELLLYYDGTNLQVLSGLTVSATNSPMVLSSVSGTNTITATGSTALVSGMIFAFVPANTNSGAVTLNISSGGAIAIKRSDGTTALSAGDLVANADTWVHYDGTVFRLLDAVTLAGSQILTNKVLTSPILNGNPQIANGSYLDLRQPVVINANIPRFASGIGQIHAASSTYNCVVEGAAVGYGGVCADDPATASNPKIRVYGLSHGTKPGCINVQSGGVTYTNDGSWHDFYDLSEGTHTGEFKIYSALFAGCARFTINGTSLALTSDDWGFADVTADSGKIAFRISGGKLQINVGTGISSTPKKFWAKFEGCVN